MQRHLRLRHHDDFALLKAEGQTVSHRLFLLSYRSNDLAHNRYGFIVMSRLGKANRRNRIRRLMREAIRARDSLIGTNHGTGYDLALIARQPITSVSYAEIVDAVDDVLQRAGLISPNALN